MSRLLPLHNIHCQNGAVFKEFHGWLMPVYFSGQTILESVLHTRRHVSLFDISHLRRHHFSAPHEATLRHALHTLLPINVDILSDGTLKYSLLLNDSGGIMDDVMLTKINSLHYTLVTNASTDAKVTEHLNSHAQSHGINHFIEENVSLAVQGPKAAELLFDGRYSDLGPMTMETKKDSIFSISRCGYTGEDGFEIECSVDMAAELSSQLLGKGAKWAGLGARDILRIEAGLPLYGQELDEDITPVDAALAWTIDKSRRQPDDTPPFPGKMRVLSQLTHPDSIARTRIGLISFQSEGSNSNVPNSKGPIPRPGMPIFASDTSVDCIGKVTSGAYSPHLNANIAMAYVKLRASPELSIKIRDQMYHYAVCKLPFVSHKYIK